LLARMLRLIRVLRLISFIPELRQIVEALVRAIPRLGYVVILIFIVFYVYAVIGSLLFAEVNENLWGNVGAALLTLFRVMTFEDWTDVMYATLNVYAWSWVYYLSFILLVSFALLNMMIGVIVQSMEDVSESKTSKKIDERFDRLESLIKSIERKTET
jgi:voltage-gated sodium channel